MKQIILVMFFLGTITTLANAQQRSPSAQQAYWGTFNRQMTPFYNGARMVNRAANGMVNYGSRLVPGGQYLRSGYNHAQRFMQRNVGLPRRYGYPN